MGSHAKYVITVEAMVRCLVDHGAGAPVGDGMDFKAGQNYRMVRWGSRAGSGVDVDVVDDTCWWTSYDIDGAYCLPAENGDVVEVLGTQEGITRRQLRHSERTARYRELRYETRDQLIARLTTLDYPWAERLQEWTDHQIRDRVVTEERKAAGKRGEDV